MITLCKDYLRLILFCSGLLMGIQIPAVVDQYAKRVDAHLTEALDIFAGFQQTAERYFNGDIQQLIAHYQASEDRVFNNDAQNIRYIVDRVTLLKTEQKALNQSAPLRVIHVLFFSEQKIMHETMQQYSYMLLLSPLALVWGLISGLLLALCFEAMLYLLARLVLYGKGKAIQ